MRRGGRRPRRRPGFLPQRNGCLLQRVCREWLDDAEVNMPHPRRREDLLWQLLLSARERGASDTKRTELPGMEGVVNGRDISDGQQGAQPSNATREANCSEVADVLRRVSYRWVSNKHALHVEKN